MIEDKITFIKTTSDEVMKAADTKHDEKVKKFMEEKLRRIAPEFIMGKGR